MKRYVMESRGHGEKRLFRVQVKEKVIEREVRVRKSWQKVVREDIKGLNG